MLESDDPQYKEAVLRLAKCISMLPCLQKKLLALYYFENMPLADIAACLDLTECEIEQIRAETVGLLRTMLAAQIGLPELPASFDNRDADGARCGRAGSWERFLARLYRFIGLDGLEQTQDFLGFISACCGIENQPLRINDFPEVFGFLDCEMF